jgi:hypothetical protein
MNDLGLEPGQHSKRLRVALEAPNGPREFIERTLSVVPERRMAKIMREACGVNKIRITTEDLTELAADLRDLERVGQPVAYEVIRSWPVDLRLRRQPAQRDAVHDARTVPLEGRARATLGRLGDPPLTVGVVVAAHVEAMVRQRLSLPVAAIAARPASSRATGTRNGEHDT